MTKDPTVEKWDDFENGNFARGLTSHNGQFCGDFQTAKIIVKSILILALSPYLISLAHLSTIAFFQAVFYMEQIYSKMLLGSIDVYTGRKNIFNSSKSMSNMKKMPHVYDQICSYFLKKTNFTHLCKCKEEGTHFRQLYFYHGFIINTHIWSKLREICMDGKLDIKLRVWSWHGSNLH